ncbi:Uncharacterised protein (plasmid) [Tsukamurella tyrosinosolvens]|uniref:Uncharacterized protein n=1 Tax=Tsukamurella tyrosinosolvens TaxID=57704 RepID=A0A1H4QQ66_TSUTY|nr:hypothetical protein [Tsukamurella tyrosinosolvens]KXO91509.1 hypothetical protein AXK58_20135 [Tsukamurella tyrosinosolvens]SEC21765.1 hypothetical protein SAMN04489793_1816 [Tsukamurella tyrosinosolvens]VEH92516.1 Uncharacterised protein [Tsukamurella tyrosinosolvens]
MTTDYIIEADEADEDDVIGTRQDVEEADDEADELESNREAQLRVRLREVDASIEAARSIAADAARSVVAAFAAPYLAIPDDLFGVGGYVAEDLLREDGTVDFAAMHDALRSLLGERPGLAGKRAVPSPVTPGDAADAADAPRAHWMQTVLDTAREAAEAGSGEIDADASNEAPAWQLLREQADAAPKREIAQRLRVKASTSELEHIEGRRDAIHRAHITAIAASVLGRGEDLFDVGGSQVADMLDGTGSVDAERVRGTARELANSRPGLRRVKRPPVYPNTGVGQTLVVDRGPTAPNVVGVALNEMTRRRQLGLA